MNWIGPRRFAWLLVALALAACDSSQTGGLLQAIGRPQPVAPPPAQSRPADGTTATAPDESGPRTPTVQQSTLPPPTAQGPSLGPLLEGRPGLTPPGPGDPPGPPGRDPSTPRVALLLPLSGGAAEVGNDMLNAAQLALFDFAPSEFELLIHDDRGTPDGAAEAARLAIGDGAQLIVGPLLAASARAVAPAARAAGVNVVAFSTDRSIVGDGVYTLGFLPAAEVESVIAHARSRGISRIAVLAPDDAYGAAVVEAARRVVPGAGLAKIQLYDPATSDFSEPIKQLSNFQQRRGQLMQQKAELATRTDEIAKQALARLEKLQAIGDLPFDALLIADGGKRLQSIAALLPFYDVDPSKIRILGTGQWDEPGTGAEPALVGGWYAAPSPDTRAEFEVQFKQAFGTTPRRLATLAYDAVALAAVLAQAEGGAHFDAAALTQASGFTGRDGLFRLLPSGLAERGLAILEVEPKGAKIIAKPRETFEAAIR